MNVMCEITDYTGINYASVTPISNPPIRIYSVFADNEMVELEIGEKKCKVSGKELIRAVEKALNANPIW